MKNVVLLASIALLSCSIAAAQSSSAPGMPPDANHSGTQATKPTPPGDRRDLYGNTIAPDGTDTPRDTNTFGSNPDAIGSRVPPGGSSTQSSQPTSATPTGDRRDRYGDTVAPDGSITPRGANTAKPSQDNSQQSPAPDSK